MLSLKNAQKVFQTHEIETTALNNVNLSIDAKEFVSIMGPSGCGKSSLLNILGLLDNITSGEHYFLGQEVSKFSEKQLAGLRKEHMGFIFQSFNLIEGLTVYDNIELPLLYQKVPEQERRQRINQILEKTGIAHRANHYTHHLSGGQQQRVAIARAVVGEPSLILADEPTGNLDSKNGSEVMALLRKLNNEGTTIVMVTHSQEHAEYAGRIINVLDGSILNEHHHGKIAASKQQEEAHV